MKKKKSNTAANAEAVSKVQSKPIKELRLDIIDGKYCFIESDEAGDQKGELLPVGKVTPMVVNQMRHLLLKPIVQNMPYDRLETFIQGEGGYQNLFRGWFDQLENTNQILLSISKYQSVANGFHNVLWLNSNKNQSFQRHYESILNVDTQGKKTFYENMSNGWNSTKRVWERGELPFKDIQDLVNYVTTKEISRIVAINDYFVEVCNTLFNVHIGKILQYLGVTLVSLDHDHFDLIPHAYYQVCYFSLENNRRISLGYLDEDWHPYLDIQNVSYHALTQTHNPDVEIEPLSADYQLVVMSNSRLRDVKSMLPALAYLLDTFQIGQGADYNELTKWYWSSRNYILKNQEIPVGQKMTINREMLTLFYNATQLLKYVIINDINDYKNITIYGDEGWQHVFPKLYSGKYIELNEKEELYRHGKALNLQFNWGLSYYQTSACVNDALRENWPFINYPPLVKTQGLAGFESIEYNNKATFDQLLVDYNQRIKGDHFRTARKCYADAMQNNLDIVNGIIYGIESHSNNEHYAVEIKETKALLETQAQQYFENNAAKINSVFNRFWGGNTFEYKVAGSSLNRYPFMHNILASDG